jgi:hypothetical protein
MAIWFGLVWFGLVTWCRWDGDHGAVWRHFYPPAMSSASIAQKTEGQQNGSHQLTTVFKLITICFVKESLQFSILSPLEAVPESKVLLRELKPSLKLA